MNTCIGMYVICETDIETHGFVRRLPNVESRYDVETGDWPATKQEWEKEHIELMKRMVEYFKNFTSVIMWSTGNESGHGDNHVKMIQWTKARDDSRLIHCEDASRKGEFHNADVFSGMYLEPDYVEELATRDPSCEPIADELRAEFIKNSQESLNELAEYAHSHGSVIAVENLPRTCLGRDSKEMLELISVNDKLRVCFDTNHVLKENVVDFVKNVKDKIVTLHVSDCDFVNERHWLPGEGKIDWPGLITALKEINYNGVWMYEIGFEAPDSIKRERDLTFVDFVHNAEQLFKQQ